jgi:hypothetical protein
MYIISQNKISLQFQLGDFLHFTKTTQCGNIHCHIIPLTQFREIAIRRDHVQTFACEIHALQHKVAVKKLKPQK